VCITDYPINTFISFSSNELLVGAFNDPAAGAAGVGVGGGGIGGFLGECDPPCGMGAGCTECGIANNNPDTRQTLMAINFNFFIFSPLVGRTKNAVRLKFGLQLQQTLHGERDLANSRQRAAALTSLCARSILWTSWFFVVCDFRAART